MVRTRKRHHEASSSANADEPVPQQGPAHPVTVQQTDGHAHPVILPAPVDPAQRVEGVQPTSSASSMEPAQKDHASLGLGQLTAEGLCAALLPSHHSGPVTQTQVLEDMPIPSTDGLHIKSPSSIWTLGKSPIKVSKLIKYLDSYPYRDDAVILKNGFQFGFRLGYTGSHKPMSCNNLLSAGVYKNEIRAKLSKEIHLGRIAGPFATPPISNLKVSPIGIVPKQDGGWRLIVHLSHPHGRSVNDGFQPNSCSVQYTSFDKVTNMVFSLGKNALMAKRDIKGAFRLFPIFPGDFHLLGMKYDNKYYIDKCLPMGLSKSPQLFEKFSSFIHWLVSVQANSESLDHYLDDFIMAGKGNTDQCSYLVNTFENICNELGVPLAEEKSVGPTTVLVFLGLELDSTEMLIRIPSNKIEELLQLLEACLARKKLSLKELQSLVGKLSFFGQAVRSGRAFLRRFYDAMAGLNKPYYKIRVNQELKQDMFMWVSFLREFNGVVYIPDDVWLNNRVMELFTDSSGNADLGCGCYFAGKWAFFQWPSVWADKGVLSDITFLEMVPVVLAVMLWGTELHDQKIIFHIDNQALVSVVNCQSSKSKMVMQLVRAFVLQTMKHNILFKACHISSSDNSIADSISRKQFGKLVTLAPQADRAPQPIPEQFHALIYRLKLTDF